MACTVDRPEGAVVSLDQFSAVVEDGVLDLSPNRPTQARDPRTCCTKQPYPENEIWQSQLQLLLSEQASLRSLVIEQHKQILQRLPFIAASTRPEYDKLRHDSQRGTVHVPTRPEYDKLRLDSQHGTVHVTWQQEGQVEESKSIDRFSAFRRTAASRRGKSNVAKSQRQSLGTTPGEAFGKINKKLPDTWTLHKPVTKDETSLIPRMRACVRSGRFEAVFTFFIFLNLATMCMQLAWRGYYSAFLLGTREHDNGYKNAETAFEYLDIAYTTIFAVELVLRVSLIGRDFVCVGVHLFDMFIVAVMCIQTYILNPAGLMQDASFVAVARLVRIVRVMRFFRVVRFAAAMTEVRILSRALSCCVGSLFWSMALLLIVISAGSILLLQLVIAYVEDENNPMELREFAHETLGTFGLSMMALWECAFTGSWHRFSRPMILQMSPYYAFFWVPYIICINFSVMRLIGALFLKETLAVAAIDAEKQQFSKMKRQGEFADRMRTIFAEGDTSGDGRISPEEFHNMLSNEVVGSCFAELELDVPEVAALFEVLAAHEGEADYDEFLNGALKLKQPSSTLDVITIIHDNQQLGRALESIYSGLCSVAAAVGVQLRGSTLHRQLDGL